MNYAAKAFLFDLNGTMIDDMQYHTQAWFEILTQDLGVHLTWEEVAQEMYGKNKEVLIRIFGEHHFSDETIEQLSINKEARYRALCRPNLKLLAGLDNFLFKAKQNNIKMGIGSAAIHQNIDFVIDGLEIRHYFQSIIAAEDVTNSKPDPETFLRLSTQFNIPPSQCIVFEDAPKGVEAAYNAGMQCIVLTTSHSINDFQQYSNVICFVNDYHALM